MLWESPTFEELSREDFRRARSTARRTEWRKENPEKDAATRRRHAAKPEAKAVLCAYQDRPDVKARYALQLRARRAADPAIAEKHRACARAGSRKSRQQGKPDEWCLTRVEPIRPCPRHGVDRCGKCASALYRLQWRRSHPEKHAASRAKWLAKDPHAYRWHNMKCAYGLTKVDFARMLMQQDFACSICRKQFTSLGQAHIDHDHATGKVRDLLCMKCNHGVGYLERPGFLEPALAYLARHKK